jgi:hypothetical protein
LFFDIYVFVFKVFRAIIYSRIKPLK